jgi:glycogen debranching enzyme
MSDGLVQILDGNTFVVSDGQGDIDASLTDPTGVFSFDTRFLSKWVLTLDGQRLNPLSVDDANYFETRFFLVPGTGTVYVDSKLSVIRRRSVGDGFQEELTILNHDAEPVDLTVRIEAASDFADLFEVKDALEKKGEYSSRVEDGKLLLGYERQMFSRSTTISATAPARLDENGLTFDVHVEPHGEWRTEIDVSARGGQPANAHKQRRANMQANLERWVGSAPRLQCDWEPLGVTYRRSLVDLAALRYSPPITPGKSLPAAGLPWFMTMFGRDSIFTSLQALPFTPELAATTLRVLGLWQGTRVDDFRDEDPGRILHEMRYGEMTAFEERPHSPYYGCADATALYVVLLDEYERWTGDRKLVRDLEQEARAALRWIDEYADLMGNGYVSYHRRNEETGLENQCWKDSWDSISYSDGRLPGFPRATCELQGYAYDAKVRGARLAREIWKDPTFAEELEKQATELKRRFNRDFWIQEDEYFALALDADGNRVDALSSNNGHLLWSGIVDKSKAKAVVRHLMGPRLFTGWGSARSRKEKDASIRSATTSARSGRSTTRSSRGGCADTASGRRQPRLLPASSTPPPFSMVGCRKRLAATGGRRPGIRFSTRPRAARRPGLPVRRFCFCERCSVSNRWAIISSPNLRSRAASACSLCSRSPGGGAASTPSPAGTSTSAEARSCSRSSGSPVGLPLASVSDGRTDR